MDRPMARWLAVLAKEGVSSYRRERSVRVPVDVETFITRLQQWGDGAGRVVPVPDPSDDTSTDTLDDAAGDLVAVSEAAELAGVSRQAIHDWKNAGRLEWRTVSGITLVSRADVLDVKAERELVKRCKESSSGAPPV